jgi:hypothetical protein
VQRQGVAVVVVFEIEVEIIELVVVTESRISSVLSNFKYFFT